MKGKGPMRRKRYGWLGLALLALLAVVFTAGPFNEPPPRTSDGAAAPAAVATEPAPPRSIGGDRARRLPGEQLATNEMPPDDPRLARCDADYQAAARARIGQLRAMADARARLAHALLQPLAHDPDPTRFEARWHEATRLIADAAARDPSDGLIAWLYANRCREERGCHAEAALARLQRAEPRNAAAWLPGIRHAMARGERRRAEILLARASEATYYDDHGNDTVRVLMDVLGDLPLPASCQAAQDALDARFGFARPVTGEDMALVGAWGVALAQTASTGPHLICKQEDPPAPSLREACAAVYARMAESDSYMARLTAATHMAELTAALPEGAQWRERLRDLYWLQEYQMPGVLAGDFQARALWEQGDWRYWQGRMEAEGRWPAPPGWLPDNPEYRALVTTGRRPPGR